MDFMVVASAQQPSSSPIITLRGDRLLRAAAMDSRSRLKSDAKSNENSPSGASASTISGTALRTLCIKVLAHEHPAVAAHIKKDTPLNCIILANMQSGVRDDFRLVPAANLDEYIFNVPNELLAEDRLVVFSVWDNMEQSAVSERRSRPVVAPGGKSTSAAAAASRQNAAKQNRSREGRSPPQYGRMGRTSKIQRVESAIEMVPSVTSSEDLRDLNVLLDNGTIRIDETLESFLCARCFHIPVLTLTISCCGAQLCPRCLPTPPGVAGTSREDRLCPVCQEEPLVPPQQHTKRDAQVSRLVKELKVLYMPQLKAQKRVRDSPDLSRPAFIIDSPVLGPL